MPPCFECGASGDVWHHVIARALGGTKTVPLCYGCHSKIHDAVLMSTRELTRLGLDKKRARGERVGNVPYGFRAIGQKLVQDEGEQADLTRMRLLHASGMTLRAIAEILNAEGRRTRCGSRWLHQYIDSLVHRRPRVRSKRTQQPNVLAVSPEPVRSDLSDQLVLV